MIKTTELNKTLGWVLTLATLGTYAYMQSKGNGGIVAILYSLFYILLFPILLIGVTVGLSRYEKLSSNGFKVGAFLLLTVLLYALWVGPTYWVFTLIVATVSGGLLFSLIKLPDTTARLIFLLIGLLLTGLVFTSVATIG
ncbi:MAG: hypothetical protein ACFHU9_14170 [Fluviicola sp.]